MKGISTVIAVLLMLIIVIALVGISYGYISGVFTSRTATVFSIVDTYGDTVTIRNDGTQSIDSFSSVTVDGDPATYLVTVQDSSLVGYWKFDEANGQTASDNSGGNTGTLGSASTEDVNDPSWASRSGSALQFDGTNDYIDAGNSVSLNFGKTTDTFTVMGWIKTTVNDGTQRGIIGKGRGNVRPFYLFIVNGQGGFKAYDGTNNPNAAGTSTVSDGKWHYLVGVKTASQLLLYVDGVLEGTATYTIISDITTTENVVIGDTTSGGSGERFNGIIDEVRVYNRDLSQSEIQAVLQGQNIRNDLVAEWKFDEATGTTAVDSSGNGNTGTLLPAGSEPKWTSKYGSALKFDGVNDYVAISDSQSINVQNFTIAVWLKAETTQGTLARLVTDIHWASGVDHGYILRMIDGKPEIALEGGFGKTRGFVRASTDIRDNNWYFVAATHQPNNTRIYINGILEDSNTLLSDPPNTTTKDTEIGGSGTVQPFNGTIDEVKIYNRALSEQEIRGLYNVGGQIKSGQLAVIKIYDALSPGSHTIRICTTGACNTGYLMIS